MELATRWYGKSLSADNPMDGYLAAWIGLEVLGPLLFGFYHNAGPKPPCSVCGNKPGRDRDRKFAGIEHIVRLRAPELLDGPFLRVVVMRKS